MDELSNWTYLIYQAPLIYDTYNCTMYEPYEPILEANEIDVDKLSCPYAPKFICNPTQKKSRQDLRTFLQIFDLIKKYLSIQLFMDKKIIRHLFSKKLKHLSTFSNYFNFRTLHFVYGWRNLKTAENCR